MNALKLLMVALLVSLITHAAPSAAKTIAAQRPKVQIAVLLDTSNSMDGLIDQAKTQLWKVVNQFIVAKKAGQRPEIEVALLEYGKDSLAKRDGYIRVIQPLTSDLDRVSEELFALRTNGGQEYCGQVIQVATQKLAWSPRPGDLKVIVIAGNEAFTQGPVAYQQAARQAIAKGIMINTIFCGNHAEGVKTKWKHGAALADGHYVNIDQNRKVPQIAAPQDAEIARLGGELNKTYIAYGQRGKKAKMRQAAQDKNAGAAAPSAMAERAVFKSSDSYSNADWDLADAVEEKKVDVGAIEDEALPAEMRGMDAKQRREYVSAQSKKRAEIQSRIQKLSKDRSTFIADKRKAQAEGGADTLDAAMIRSIRSQAEKKDFRFE